MWKKVAFCWCFVFGYACAEPIDTITPTLFTYYTESYAPANYVENDVLTGASVDTLKLIWRDMGVAEQSIKMVPWARGYRNTLKQPLTVLFSMIRTPERENLFKWVGPIFTNSLAFISSSDFNHDINDVKDTFEYTVVTVRDDVSEFELIKTGFPKLKMFSVTKLDQALKMIKSKRADLMLLTYESLPALVVQNDMSESEFKRVWTLSVNGNYYAFNRSTPDRLINQFQQALDNVREQHISVLEQHGLSL
ncbi:substrate-binding periplasmic protein [Thalassotalea atypica]|uniref:substrate-binding periplasmic protein n=1 Tax=Thalassotalea atypica TaxID=2054316 RepID=UPI002573CE99|nr:transporter substrate-binding domain-containing protein [Thalassotalea atypica]